MFSAQLATGLLLGVLVVAIVYVRLAWWLGRRFGRAALPLICLGATLLLSGLAAATRGVASADEMMFASPARAWLEAAVVAGVLALPAFGLATHSVSSRLARSQGGPTAGDWTAGVVSGIVGLLLPIAAVSLFLLLA